MTQNDRLSLPQTPSPTFFNFFRVQAFNKGKATRAYFVSQGEWKVSTSLQGLLVYSLLKTLVHLYILYKMLIACAKIQNRRSPNIIHDKLDHKATLPCLSCLQSYIFACFKSAIQKIQIFSQNGLQVRMIQGSPPIIWTLS